MTIVSVQCPSCRQTSLVSLVDSESAFRCPKCGELLACVGPRRVSAARRVSRRGPSVLFALSCALILVGASVAVLWAIFADRDDRALPRDAKASIPRKAVAQAIPGSSAASRRNADQPDPDMAGKDAAQQRLPSGDEGKAAPAPGEVPGAKSDPSPPAALEVASRTDDAVSELKSGQKVLLSPAILDRLRKEAQTGTARWKAFQAELDKNLNEPIRGGYQASGLERLSDYALGYLIVKDSDPKKAGAYADKAVAVLKSGLHDFQKGEWTTLLFLARGDGSTRSFQLPDKEIVPSSVKVYLTDVSTKAAKHAKSKGADEVEYYSRFLKVSNTPDGPADYAETKDWRHNPDLANNMIDWSPGGKEPAPGGTYHVTSANLSHARPTQATVQGDKVLLPTAPASDRAVFVEYVYGSHAADFSHLAYQQTGTGDGGFNSILVDTGYTSRYLGKHIAMGLDWLDGYGGLSSSLQREAMDLLVRWSDHLRDRGYYREHPESNYEAGTYVSRVMTALVLASRHAEGTRLLRETLEYRRKHLLPVLRSKPPGLKGGFWAEGWNYGVLATKNLLLAALALESTGAVKEVTEERQWASEVIRHLVSAQSTPESVYDGGDWYAYPAPFPAKSLFYLLAASADQPESRAYAEYIIAQYSGKEEINYLQLLYRDPKAEGRFWSDLPLEHFAEGTGLLTARSDWGKTPTWVAFQLGNHLKADHQSYVPGQLQIHYGPDDLLINAHAPGKSQPAWRGKNLFGNVILVEDGGDKILPYPGTMGVWEGTPGVFINAYQAEKDYVYIGGDYHAAYSPPTKPGSGGPARELTRQVVYLRPNYIVVYDRVATLKESYTKELRWHFLNTPKVTGNSFIAEAGNSKLFGQTFSTMSLVTSTSAEKVGNATVHQLRTHGEKPSTDIRFVTAFEVAKATAKTMAPTRHVTDAGGLMEGAQIGGEIVLFGRTGPIAPSAAVRYKTTSKGSLRHLLTDLRPGQEYQAKVNGKPVARVAATDQGTIRFQAETEGDETVEVVATQ
jgi:hypothetical protein